MLRPLRLYTHTFMHAEHAALNIVAEGRTPCEARRSAFRKLERRIHRDALPQRDWRLLRQVPYIAGSG